MSAFGQIADIGDRRNVRVPAPMRHERSPPQSPIPGFGEKYCSLSGLPSHSLESIGGAFLTVIFGQIFAYFAFSDSHSSSHGAHLDTVHDFAANAALIDDVGQSGVLSADRCGELSSRCSPFG